jgi:hypothetical protein
MGGGWGGLKVSPMKILLKATLPPPKNGIFEEIFDFFGKKNAILEENFWDLSRFSQICSKIFKKNLTPPPLKIFLNPYPPPKIFGQAHVCI